LPKGMFKENAEALEKKSAIDAMTLNSMSSKALIKLIAFGNFFYYFFLRSWNLTSKLQKSKRKIFQKYHFLTVNSNIPPVIHRHIGLSMFISQATIEL